MTNQNASYPLGSATATPQKELTSHTAPATAPSVTAESNPAAPYIHSQSHSESGYRQPQAGPDRTASSMHELIRLREQLLVQQELPTDRTGLDIKKAQKILEIYQDTPGTTLFITSDWQLLTKAEIDGNPAIKVIGRCEIKVYKDEKDATKEVLQFHRIEVDLTTYAQPAGGIQRYFLEYMLRWLDIKPSPYIFRFVNKKFSSTMATEFGEAKISFSVN
jgi:hypothetical protein